MAHGNSLSLISVSVNLFWQHTWFDVQYHWADNSNATFPVEAPPTQVDLNVPVGQTARAARTQPSHLPLLMLIVAPAVTALRLKRAFPEEPVVEAGAPPHFVIAPAMPPHMASSATFWLEGIRRFWNVARSRKFSAEVTQHQGFSALPLPSRWFGRGLLVKYDITVRIVSRNFSSARYLGNYADVSTHTVSRTAFGSTVVEARRRRISERSCVIAANGMDRTHVKTDNQILMIPVVYIMYGGEFDSWLKTKARFVQEVKNTSSLGWMNRMGEWNTRTPKERTTTTVDHGARKEKMR